MGQKQTPSGPLAWLTRGIQVVFVVLGLAFLVVLLPIVLPFVFVYAWWEDYRTTTLRREFERRWGAQGKRGLLVYSNSPHWKAYIEANWLPRLGERLVVLNWSDRNSWAEKHPFEAELFRHFGGDREFNPLAVVFTDRPAGATFRAWLAGIRARDPLQILAPHVGEAKVVRFWRPFRDFKHGKEHALRAAESELFAAVNGDAPHVGV